MRSTFHFWFAIIFLIAPTKALFSQGKSGDKAKPTIGYNLYLDVFYGYDFNEPKTSTRLPFIYNYNRHNEVNLNLGYLGFNLKHAKYRANFKMHAGTFVIDNYTNEPNTLSLINDANIGISLNKKNNLWLDVGIFGSSYIGFEGTIGFDNKNLGHSILSENVPYYLSGASLSYDLPDWTFEFWLVNGWQRIKRVQGSTLPGLGTRINHAKENWSVEWSTFVGTDDPDSTRRMRYFNHLNSKWSFHHNWHLILAFDLGLQQRSKGSSSLQQWYALAGIIEYKLSKKWYSVFRYEFYSDPDEVIVNTPPKLGYVTQGYTITFRHHFNRMLIAKIEARYFDAPEQIYPKEKEFTNGNFFLVGSLAFKLDGTF